MSHRRTVRSLPRAPGAAGFQALREREAQWRPREVPDWVQRVHSTHNVQWLGGVVACTTCGGMSATPTGRGGLLRAPCRRLIPDGSRRRIGLFSCGLRPFGYAAWPDGRAAPDELRAHISLEYREYRWFWAIS